MGLLYPDHPDDNRPGLFERNERSDARHSSRPTDRRSTRRREERPARTHDEPVTTSTTSSDLKSLNDLMVRPPAPRRESDRVRRERDDFRDARRQERRERRERRERTRRDRTPSPEPRKRCSRREAEPERTPSPVPRSRPSRRAAEHEPDSSPPRRRQPERSPSSSQRSPRDEEDRRRARGPRTADRPRYERHSRYESDRRRESSSPRKRRPSVAEKRNSSYDTRRASYAEPKPSLRQHSRARYHSRAENDLIAAVPVPPPFTRAESSEAPHTREVDAAPSVERHPSVDESNSGERHLAWKAPLETILSESHPQHDPAPSDEPVMPSSPNRDLVPSEKDLENPSLDRKESFVSSYLEGSNLELGAPPPRAYRPTASDDTYSDSEYYSRRRSRRPRSSAWDEVEYYKYGQAPEDDPPPRRGCCMCCSGWSRRRKLVVIGGIIASVILVIILIAVAATVAGNKYDYKPSDAQVTNAQAFKLGGATHNDPNDVNDGSAQPVDQYTYYQGDASNFPDPATKWISFQSMWNANLNTLQHSCGWLDQGKDNTPKMIQQIFDAIQDRANASLVDHRFIFATILQESNGCPRVGETESSGGVRNPGLMQSHNGHAYVPKHSRLSILQMVQDGTQGTEHGDGIVQNLNLYQSPYKAARGYNSGYIPKDGNLSTKSGATKCYVSDIANRLTGWVTAESSCHEG